MEILDIVNYRAMGSGHGPEEGSIAEQVMVLADLQRKGLIRHIGLSNVTPRQLAQAQNISYPESSGRDPTRRNSIRAGSARHRRGRPIVLEIQTTLAQRIGELAKKLPSASATDRGSIICSM